MASTVIPGLRYQDAKAAIAFLVDAFGFEPGLVVEGEGDIIEHGQLIHGAGMVMLGSTRDDEYSRLVGSDTSPTATGVYVIVEDVAAHAEQARAAGAEILIEPAEQDYGGSNYTARDPEGHIWNFGSYNPWRD